MRRPTRRQAGFSFIEILVVMGIIAVLSGLVLVAINMWTRKGPEFQTEQRLGKLSGAASAVKQKWNMYPPGTLAALGPVSGTAQAIKKVPNHTNEGIEALVQAMYWRGVEYDPQMGEAEFGNTDDDALDKAVGVHGPKLLEVVDGYGNPIVYIPHTEYSTAQDKGMEYTLGDAAGRGSVTVRPWKTENGFENPNSYQIFSLGPDNLPNTDDDIKGW